MPPIPSDTPTEAFLIDLYDRIQVLGSDEPGSATQGPAHCRRRCCRMGAVGHRGTGERVEVAGYPVLTGEQRQRPQSPPPLSCRYESMTRPRHRAPAARPIASVTECGCVGEPEAASRRLSGYSARRRSLPVRERVASHRTTPPDVLLR